MSYTLWLFPYKLYVYKKPHTMISVWLHIILGNKD